MTTGIILKPSHVNGLTDSNYIASFPAQRSTEKLVIFRMLVLSLQAVTRTANLGQEGNRRKANVRIPSDCSYRPSVILAENKIAIRIASQRDHTTSAEEEVYHILNLPCIFGSMHSSFFVWYDG